MKEFIHRLYLATDEEKYDSLGDAIRDHLLSIFEGLIIILGALVFLNAPISKLPEDQKTMILMGIGAFLGAIVLAYILVLLTKAIIGSILQDIWYGIIDKKPIDENEKG